MPRQLRREDYTVGWVCALPIELAAAQEMLDEEHGPPERFDNDENLYHLGSIAGHNVVIVCLPAGRIGNNPAAAVATQTRATFQGIRFGLMVGVGGGVPTADVDIRLGDVVVSQPDKTFGGVVQYDSGKSTLSGFERTGSLNSPPQILLAAVVSVRANELRGRSGVPEHVASLNQVNTFQRHRAGPDVLFKPTYPHEGGNTCDKCSADEQESRERRESEEEVAIHYGTIASGNKVIKDAAERDKISADLGGVLCFEMEAAGLMNNFPCLVIRGICDYSDSHKNKKWQPYAATTAAAYAKEVLSVIPPADVAKTRTIDEATRETSEETKIDHECIQQLRPSDPRDDKRRIEEAKGGLLKDSYRWILYNADFREWRYNSQSRLLWIKGDPGKGKTMLLCGIANELKSSIAKTDLLCFFFCQATDSRINNATAVLRGLLFLLLDQQPSLILHIREKYNSAGKALFEDTNAWVALSQIFTSILQDPSLNNTYLIVDALDECIEDLPKLLDFIVHKSISCRAKWIVSSRNWPKIEERLEKAGHKVRLCLELNTDSISTAVSTFIQHKVLQLAHKKNYDRETQSAVFDHLFSNADNTFLWVALVCQLLDETPRWDALASIDTLPPGLDSLYERMMQQISNSRNASLCKQILALVATAYRPITLSELAAFVEQLEKITGGLESVKEIIGFCYSFLTIQEDTIYFVHQSAKDFLFAGAYERVFPSGTEEIHYRIYARSLEILLKTLRRDIYNIEDLGCLIDQVKQPSPDPLVASRYSCIYWIDHLSDWYYNASLYQKSALQDGGSLDRFIRKKYLYWLEALSLCKSMSKGVVSMAKLEALVQQNADVPRLSALVWDARRFIMSHKGAIENSPLQAYASALLFSPTRSAIRHLFKREELDWITIKPDMELEWSQCLQTLECHSSSVTSVAFSHDSMRLASASKDNTIRIWDASSGQCLQTLEGHSNSVNSVAFSNDSTRLASASDDYTVRIWDASSGQCLQTLNGHSYLVTSVAFSNDSTRLASSSYNTIKIWDVSSGQCLQMLEGHSHLVSSVTFSNDSTRLASASDDQTIMIWDASSGQCLQTLGGHSHSVNSVVFSNDSTRLASASDDYTVRIWDASSGQCLQTLEGHSYLVSSVAFSTDSTRLASASYITVRIWDASSGQCLQTLEVHSSSVTSVTFSNDSTRLASASKDWTVRIWDASSRQSPQALEGHSSSVYSVAFSNDSTRLASASATYDYTIRIWDASNGQCLRTLDGHSNSINSVAFSNDSTRLASTSDDNTVKIWDTRSGQCLQTLEGHSHSVTSAAFSNDSTRLASASDDNTVRIWDTSSGQCLWTLEGHSHSVNSVAFSNDSTRLASAAYDYTVRIWDASNYQCLQTHNIGMTVHDISFDVNNSSLDTDIGTIDISTPSDSKIRPIHPQPGSPRYKGLAFSEDNIWLTYSSKNILWLPLEYRPECTAFSDRTVGIGVGSGRVWICKVEHDTP